MKTLMYATFAAALGVSLCATADAQATFDRASVSKATIQAELDDTFKQLQMSDPRTNQQKTLVSEALHAHDDADAALRNGETLRAQELADASADLLNALNPTRPGESSVSSQITAADPVLGNAGDMRQVAREDVSKSDLIITGMIAYSIAGSTSVDALTDIAKASLADAKSELETDAPRAYSDSRRARYAAHAAQLIASASDKSLIPPPMEERSNPSEQHSP